MLLKEKIRQINSFISRHQWFDMEVLKMRGGTLKLIGSTDFTYQHTLEIEFKDVFHTTMNMEWSADPSKPVVELVEGQEAIEINSRYRIEQGNFLFRVLAEDLKEPFYVAAKGISYNTDKVLYYKKDSLEKNERIADWVK